MTPQLHDLSDEVGPIAPTSAADRHRARLAVAARAYDTDDTRVLLGMLELLERGAG